MTWIEVDPDSVYVGDWATSVHVSPELTHATGIGNFKTMVSGVTPDGGVILSLNGNNIGPFQREDYEFSRWVEEVE